MYRRPAAATNSSRVDVVKRPICFPLTEPLGSKSGEATTHHSGTFLARQCATYNQSTLMVDEELPTARTTLETRFVRILLTCRSAAPRVMLTCRRARRGRL
jgi:hypothetical protein